MSKQLRPIMNAPMFRYSEISSFRSGGGYVAVYGFAHKTRQSGEMPSRSAAKEALARALERAGWLRLQGDK